MDTLYDPEPPGPVEGVLHSASLRPQAKRRTLLATHRNSAIFFRLHQGSMKWVTAGVTRFVNLSVVCGLFLDPPEEGWSTVSAALCWCAALHRSRRFLWDSQRVRSDRNPLMAQPQNKIAQIFRGERNAQRPITYKYAIAASGFMVAVCFAVFAVRSFCWLLYIDSSGTKIHNPQIISAISSAPAFRSKICQRRRSLAI